MKGRKPCGNRATRRCGVSNCTNREGGRGLVRTQWGRTGEGLECTVSFADEIVILDENLDELTNQERILHERPDSVVRRTEEIGTHDCS